MSDLIERLENVTEDGLKKYLRENEQSIPLKNKYTNKINNVSLKELAEMAPLQDQTWDGKKCMNWNSNNEFRGRWKQNNDGSWVKNPETHEFISHILAGNDEGTIGKESWKHNYCRNPDNDPMGAWCWTDASIIWNRQDDPWPSPDRGKEDAKNGSQPFYANPYTSNYCGGNFGGENHPDYKGEWKADGVYPKKKMKAYE